MLTLSILRHAKSSWDQKGLADFDRPLAPRGIAAAPRMGRHMCDIGLVPDLVLCSAAVRTRATAELAMAAYGQPQPEIVIEKGLYEASDIALLARLRQVPDRARHVLLIGHNPGLQDLVLTLARRPLAREHADLMDKLPTAALVVLELPADSWRDLAAGTGRIVEFATPRRLAP